MFLVIDFHLFPPSLQILFKGAQNALLLLGPSKVDWKFSGSLYVFLSGALRTGNVMLFFIFLIKVVNISKKLRRVDSLKENVILILVMIKRRISIWKEIKNK